MWKNKPCVTILEKNFQGRANYKVWWQTRKPVSKDSLRVERGAGAKLDRALLVTDGDSGYTQSASRETRGWKTHTLESRLAGEIAITSDMQMTPPLWQRVKKN